VTNADVIAAFQGFINDRASAGVVIAKAATNVSFSNRVVTVTVDPSKVGLTLSDFQSINPFDNLAEFYGDPIMFDDETGTRLRPAIDSASVVLPDGTNMGSATTAQLYNWGTGK